ncbi:PPC domain-containing DNA-binding protein [Rhodoferax sp.]|uniref:PPC domain-containing DNA-binding protein n=1 Tax=Rhodoferax sp. TaxID=50421 RepID=UPI00374DC3CD
MNPAVPSTLPSVRSRTLTHPGPFNPVRIQSKRCAKSRHFRLYLQPGLSLFDALIKPLTSAGVGSASVTILGGYFDNLDYCVAPPDPSKSSVIAYTPPIHSGSGFMIFGNATVGKNVDGTPIVHCHAALRTETGAVKGGHIITQTCIVGSQSASALVTTLDGFELRVMFDAETNIPLLQPQEVSSHA